jgi:hypothetical protein
MPMPKQRMFKTDDALKSTNVAEKNIMILVEENKIT